MEKNKIQIKIIDLRRILAALIALFKRFKKSKKREEKRFEEFALALRKRESNNNYQAVNSYGYLGAYQFGMARLCDLGYTQRIPGTTGYSNRYFSWKPQYSKGYFLNNPNIQDKIFKKHCQKLIRRIKFSFSYYLGKKVKGIEITLSGLVAGAHLGGIGGISKFLKGYYNSHDQFGTSVSSYIKKFAGYNLENI